MNRRKKTLLIQSSVVGVLTVVAVLAVANVKDWINRREAMLAMEQLGQRVQDYRKTYNSVPPQDYVAGIRDQLAGHVRLGTLVYRGQWIDLESDPNEILAFSRKRYRSLLIDDGVIVLRLGGRVEWMAPNAFAALATQQRHPGETGTPDEF